MKFTNSTHFPVFVFSCITNVIPFQSNSLNRFAQTVKNKLFPQTYGFVSAGSPERIPTLTYEYLKEFHNKYYHPSNSW